MVLVYNIAGFIEWYHNIYKKKDDLFLFGVFLFW